MTIFDILTWCSVVISIVSFLMYLLGKLRWYNTKHIPNWAIIMVAVSCAIIAIIFAYIDKAQLNEPYNIKEKRAATALTKDISQKWMEINKQIRILKDTKRQVDDFQKEYASAKPNELEQIHARLVNLMKEKSNEIDTSLIYMKPSKEVFGILAKTRIPSEEVDAFYNLGFPTAIQDIKKFYDKRVFMSTRNQAFDFENGITDCDYQVLLLSTQALFYSTLSLSTYLPKKDMNYFYDFANNNLTEFHQKKVLTYSESEGLTQKCMNKINELLDNLSSKVGEINLSLKSKEEELKQKKAELDKFNNLKLTVAKKKAILAKKTEELETQQKELIVMQEKVRQKFKLSDDDTQWQIWAKLIKLTKIKMYEDAILDLNILKNRFKAEDPSIETYVKSAEAFYLLLNQNQQAFLPVPEVEGEPLDKLGILVMGFENNATHSVLKTGDIILFHKGHAIHSVEEYISDSTNNVEDRRFTILRINENGVLDKMEISGSKSDPRIAINDLFAS